MYRIWQGIRSRCHRPNATGYADYGGRGIKVCDEWLNSFEQFYADMGDPPDEYSIDRIDVDGNYEPSNCRWASVKQQARNKRASKYVVLDGKTLYLNDAIEALQRRAFTLAKRRNSTKKAEQLSLV